MILLCESVLSPDEAACLARALDAGEPADADGVAAAVMAHPMLTLAAQPRRLSPVSFLRDLGVERAARGPVLAGDVRADVGVVVFLTDGSGSGGDLLIDAGFGDEPVRARAGHAVVFPASAQLQREAAASGPVWTAHMWAESLVREQDRREILYDVGCSVELLRLFTPEHEAMAPLERSYDRLLRIWAGD